MKAIFLLSFIALTLSTAYAQTIRRVNNNPGVTGVNVYSSAQAAHDAAAPNDILLIEPSDTNYGTITVSKPLKIYGNGYFLEQNSELRVVDRSSYISIDLINGGTGSEVYGINGEIRIYGASNIKVARCQTSVYIYTKRSTTNYDISNIVIRNNYIDMIDARPTDGFSITDVFVENNLVIGRNTCCLHTLLAIHSGIDNFIIRNNLFYGAYSYSIAIVNAIFENNLIDGDANVSFDNVSYSYNISSGDHFPGGIANQNNVDFSNEFLGTGSDDEKFMVKSGSYLKTSASDGGEIGPFGGNSPYIISGIPPIPSVTAMYNTGTGSNDVPLQATISVQSNN